MQKYSLFQGNVIIQYNYLFNSRSSQSYNGQLFIKKWMPESMHLNKQLVPRIPGCTALQTARPRTFTFKSFV